MTSIQPSQCAYYTYDDLWQIGIKKSRITLLRWESRNAFPRRVRMGGTSVAWLKADVDAWREKLAAERGTYHYADLG